MHAIAVESLTQMYDSALMHVFDTRFVNDLDYRFTMSICRARAPSPDQHQLERYYAGQLDSKR